MIRPACLFESVLESLQSSASDDAWHRGLALARAGAIHLTGCDPGAWRFRVDLDPPASVAWTSDGWRCSCDAGPACAHVVAAACVLRAVDLALVHVPRLLRETEPARPLALQTRAEPLPAREAPPASTSAPATDANTEPPPQHSGHDDDQGDHVVAAERLLLEPRWQANGDHFDVAFEATTQDGRTVAFSAAAVVRAWRSGTYAVQTLNGDVAWLPQDWLERFGATLEQLTMARGADGKQARWSRPAAAELCEALNAPPPPELVGLRALANDFTAIPAAPLPEHLRAILRDYQRRGVDWLCLLRDTGIGALLADDMGLGKTLQTLCAIAGRTLVIAPTSTLHNWRAELARFRPDLSVHLYHGPKRALLDADVTLTSYAILRLDAEALAARAWDTLVLDEAQAIKEPTTATAAAAFALKARWRVALSGTPVENRLLELWSLSHFLNPGLLGGRKDFLTRYAKPLESGQAGPSGLTRAHELQRKLKPFVLRRRKSEVATELPPRTELVLRCTLDPAERTVYDSLRLAAHADLVALLARGANTFEALELLLRLRQAACHLALVPGQTATRSSKLDLLLEQLVENTAAGHRALVFSQWTSLLDLVEPALKEAGLEFCRLDGSTDDRGGVVARFQADDGPPVMLLSLKAGGTGINLTAADHVYLLDPWWNPAVEDQAADRSHRIGQERPVFIHRLIAEDTVEDKILELHQRKRALAVTVVEGAQTPALTREDLLGLLQT